MSVIDEVKSQLSFNNSLNADFCEYSKMYLMTTENIKDYLSIFDLTDKEVLSVCGSGDQLLNAYLFGAKNVTCFDINYLALLFLRFKVEFIKNLSYSEFCQFFIQDKNYMFLDSNIYLKLRSVLDNDLKEFFDFNFLEHSQEDKYNLFFYKFNIYLSKLKQINNYFSQEAYDKLSKILQTKEIDIIQSDISSLPERLSRNYDFMLFSNISDYIEGMYPENSLLNYKELIKRFLEYLNKDGIIQTGYIYDIKRNNKLNVFASNTKRRKNFRFGEGTQIIETDLNGFESLSTDKVITLKKR